MSEMRYFSDVRCENSIFLHCYLLLISKGYMKKINPENSLISPTGMTKFCFLFGELIAQSPSPALQTSWFHRLSMNVVYLACPIPESKIFLNLLRSLMLAPNFLGGNITMPFKGVVCEIDEIDKSRTVLETGSANTIYRSETGRWSLENTDIYGLEETFKKLLTGLEGFQVLLFGGGGAAASVMFVCERNPNCRQVQCFTRNPEKTLQNYPISRTSPRLLVRKLERFPLEQTVQQLRHSGDNVIVINTLPLGYGPHVEQNSEVIFALQALEKVRFFDLVYLPTEPLKWANENGVLAVDGQTMFVAQAQRSFSLWTGREPLL